MCIPMDIQTVIITDSFLVYYFYMDLCTLGVQKQQSVTKSFKVTNWLHVCHSVYVLHDVYTVSGCDHIRIHFESLMQSDIQTQFPSHIHRSYRISHHNTPAMQPCNTKSFSCRNLLQNNALYAWRAPAEELTVGWLDASELLDCLICLII